MGTLVQLKNQINNSYFQLKDSVEDKLILTEEKIKSKLASDDELVQKMTKYHLFYLDRAFTQEISPYNGKN